ncbi:MAG: hypothetical protein MAG451_02751 [Anaerolineales bacterium]|nr:hypothetical protein [Anaerolineales bacterium]
MPEEEEQEGRELHEEAPAYLERYQEAREDHLAAELRRLEEAVRHNADRIQDFRDVMEQQFQQVDRRFVELRSEIDQRFRESERRSDERFAALDERLKESERRSDERFAALDERFKESERRFAILDTRFAALNERFESVDQRFESLERLMDHRHQDIKENIERSNRWTRAFFAITISFLVPILGILVKLLIG